MVGILICIGLVIIIQIIAIIFLFSNIVLDVESCDIYYDEMLENKIKVRKLKVSIKIYIFHIIKILNIKIHRNYCEIFKIKIKLNLLKNLKEDEQSGIMFVLKNIGKLKAKVKNINFELDFGTENVVFTTFLVPIISTILSIYISKNLDISNCLNKEEKSDYNLRITPKYVNTNNFRLIASGQISFKFFNTIFFIKKHKAIKI